MIFLKKSLITVTILVFTMWILPADSAYNDVLGKCQEILQCCGFKNNAEDFKFAYLSVPQEIADTFKTILYNINKNDITQETRHYILLFRNNFDDIDEIRIALNKLNNELIKNKENSDEIQSKIAALVRIQGKIMNGKSLDSIRLDMLKNIAEQYMKYINTIYHSGALETVYIMQNPIGYFCASQIPENDYRLFWNNLVL